MLIIKQPHNKGETTYTRRKALINAWSRIQSLFIYNLLTHQISREQLYCFAQPLLVFTPQASKRQLNVVSPLRKYQDPCIQQKQEPALVCCRSCGFGAEDLFEQRMWYHKQNKWDLSLQWPLKPLKIYIGYIYFGGGVSWCVEGGAAKEAEGIHWPSSCSDGSEKSQSLLCKELKPPLQIAPIFV